MALETEADPDRSPVVRFASRIAPLAVPAGEEGGAAIDLLEDRIRHAGRFDPAAFDRQQWVARNAAPPRSAWRVYDDTTPGRLLATLLIFGRQTDREPEAVLQGFAPDVEQARPAVESALGCSFGGETITEAMPAVNPTSWLAGAQFRLKPPASAPLPAKPGEPTEFDALLAEQRRATWDRFLAVWPDTPLPELLGMSPRQAVADPQLARRVEALVSEGEATSRRPDASAAWTAVRPRLGLTPPGTLASTRPFDDAVPPLRWHRLAMAKLSLDDLRGVLVTSMGAGFERAAAGEAAVAEAAVVARPDPIKGNALVAFVTIKSTQKNFKQAKLAEELRNHVAKEIGHIAKPDDIRFAEALPKTRSGKIMRRLLREIVTGAAATGDTTTLEDTAVLERLR
jgi:hypothetical protein